MWHLLLFCKSSAIVCDKSVEVKELQSSNEVKWCSALCTLSGHLSLFSYPFTFSAKAYHFKIIRKPRASILVHTHIHACAHTCSKYTYGHTQPQPFYITYWDQERWPRLLELTTEKRGVRASLFTRLTVRLKKKIVFYDLILQLGLLCVKTHTLSCIFVVS